MKLVLLLGGGFALYKISQGSAPAAGPAALPGGSERLDAPAVPGSPAAGVALNPARTVSMPESFHFRSSATAAPVGPLLPAGTRVEIGPENTGVTRGTGARLELLMHAMRSNGDWGYVFLPVSLLGSGAAAPSSKGDYSAAAPSSKGDYSAVGKTNEAVFELRGFDFHPADVAHGRAGACVRRY